VRKQFLVEVPHTWVPERLYHHFVDTTGTLVVDEQHVTVELTRRTWIPVLLQAGYAEMDLPNPVVGRASAALPPPMTGNLKPIT
jgi:hypothetical protein